MKEALIPLSRVYVPAKLKVPQDPDAIETLALEIMEEGLHMPIRVRLDHERKRYVLVHGLKRVEAVKMLGETEIRAVFVEPRQY